MAGGSNVATLAIIYRQPEAAVLVSMLRAYGIAAFVPVWNFATVVPHLTVGVGGMAVLVPAAQLEPALELIGDPEDLPLPRRNFRCGRVCNIVLTLLLWFTIGFIPPPRAKGSYARVASAA